MEFFRQEYWSGLPFPSAGHLPNPGIKPASPAWQVDSLPLMHQGSSNNASYNIKKKDGLTLVQGLTMFSGHPPDHGSAQFWQWRKFEYHGLITYGLSVFLWLKRRTEREKQDLTAETWPGTIHPPMLLELARHSKLSIGVLQLDISHSTECPYLIRPLLWPWSIKAKTRAHPNHVWTQTQHEHF